MEAEITRQSSNEILCVGTVSTHTHTHTHTHTSQNHTLVGPDVPLKVAAVLQEVGVTVGALLCTLHHQSFAMERECVCQYKQNTTHTELNCYLGNSQVESDKKNATTEVTKKEGIVIEIGGTVRVLSISVDIPVCLPG